MNIDAIADIIKEPVHGSQFYSKATFADLVSKVQHICGNLEITEQSKPESIISIVNNYIKYNVSLRNQYFDTFCERTETFDTNELVYRTAYAALEKGEAMCAGFTEAVRVLLSQYGIKTHTLLTKLPGKNKRLLHYVAVAEYEKDGEKKYIVLDPERQANCERKGMDFEKYQSNMLYALPHPIFTNDVVGETGLGMQAEEYFSHPEIIRTTGTSQIGRLINNTYSKKNIKEELDGGEINRD